MNHQVRVRAPSTASAYFAELIVDIGVISFSGDGGRPMLMGDLLTTVQENLPVKVAVFNNGALGFVEIEQKVEGLLDAYTDLHNPDFGRVAEAIGMWGRRVEEAAAVDEAVRKWLQAPGPALIDVVVARNELVMPPKTEPSQLLGTALYSAKAILVGRTEGVIDLAKGRGFSSTSGPKGRDCLRQSLRSVTAPLTFPANTRSAPDAASAAY